MSFIVVALLTMQLLLSVFLSLKRHTANLACTRPYRQLWNIFDKLFFPSKKYFELLNGKTFNCNF